jgi:hypothetical protein
MAGLFRPRITNPAIAGDIRITPQIKTPAYRMHTINVVVAEGLWAVAADNSPPVTGAVSLSGIESAVIYGKNTLLFPSRDEGSWQLTFASPGANTLADVAQALRTTTKPALDTLPRLPSLLSDDDKTALTNACHKAYEPAIVVCAASLLLAGAVGASPIETA